MYPNNPYGCCLFFPSASGGGILLLSLWFHMMSFFFLKLQNCQKVMYVEKSSGLILDMLIYIYSKASPL